MPSDVLPDKSLMCLQILELVWGTCATEGGWELTDAHISKLQKRFPESADILKRLNHEQRSS